MTDWSGKPHAGWGYRTQNAVLLSVEGQRWYAIDPVVFGRTISTTSLGLLFVPQLFVLLKCLFPCKPNPS